MVSRICPNCGATWYSADSSGTWVCGNCGTEISPELAVEIKQGDKVRLTEKVRHAEFRGLTGTVKKVIKSRGVVAVLCENGKRYDALPENIEPL